MGEEWGVGVGGQYFSEVYVRGLNGLQSKYVKVTFAALLSVQ